MNGDAELVTVERSLKGPPAAIFLALVLHGGPQTARMLCHHTGYCGRVVRQGLAHLTASGLTYNDPDLHAWYLVGGTMLLTSLQEALLTSLGDRAPGGARPTTGEANQGGGPGADARPSTAQANANRPGAGKANDPTGSEYDLRGTEYDPRGAENDPVRTEHDLTGSEYDLPGADSGQRSEEFELAWEIYDGPAGAESDATGTENDPAGTEKYPEESENDSVGAKSFPSRACITTTTAKSPDTLEQEVVSKQAGKKRGRASPRRSPEARVMAAWLERGGVGRYSPKMDELLARDLDLEVVQAHVLERLACEKGLVSGQPIYTPGLLVRKLEDGDPPPPMRCEKCFSLRRLSSLGWCDCELEQVISR